MDNEQRNNELLENRISRFEINQLNRVQRQVLNALEENKIYFDKVTDMISAYFGIDRKEIKSKSRKGKTVKARGFIIYFIYKNLYRRIKCETLIFRVIGTYLARDRITIRYHKNQMKFLIEQDREYKQHHFSIYIKLVSYDII